MTPLLPAVLLAATFAAPPSADAGAVDFARDVQPILEGHCTDCHGEWVQESNLRLDSRLGMQTGGDTGSTVLKPGDAEGSYLLDVVRHRDPGMEMPPDSEMIPVEEIAVLRAWIEQGAVWPGQMDDVPVREESDHWAYQPVERPDPPAGPGVDGDAAPIDAFLQEKLHDAGLTYSAPAEPAALIRRASIVLTGLAPTPEEVTAFEAACEEDPDAALVALVDRLLASPRYGERFAQHWLDVIRWAETNGSESNMYRKNAWIYRDYVVRAFNEDVPYDRFLTEQLAGDVLGVGEATGYLVAGPHVPAATVGQEPAARRQARADRLDEIVQTVGASVLGTTVSCARCHNHKFDPVTIQDYYALTAVFADVEYDARRPELAPGHPRRERGEELWDEIRSHRRLLREDGGAWTEDWRTHREMFFNPVETDAVRLTFEGKGVGLDEWELFGPADWRENLAAASTGAVASANPATAVPRGEAWKVNDGRTGTEAWRAKVPDGSVEKPWIMIEFPDVRRVDRMTYSRNREDLAATDYLEGLATSWVPHFTVEVRNAVGEWEPVADTKSIQSRLNRGGEAKATHDALQASIETLLEEGPQLSFIGKFVDPGETFVFRRGSPESPGEQVAPDGPAAFGESLGLPTDAPGPARRKAFAERLTRPDHPLTARVMVNRLWHHLFGAGLVTTTADFGAAGTEPTHPDLLDWLAAEFVDPQTAGPHAEPWSVKHMVRLMALSRAFRQSSLPREDGLAADAGAALLWRYPPKRVEAEVIRDSILQASGCLDETVGGPSYRIHNVKKRYAQWEVVDNHGPHTWRRMLYQERMRRVDDRMFTAFDFPDCGQVRGKRPVSTTPLQALNLMNSEFAVDQARCIAERAEAQAEEGDDDAVTRSFLLILGREPADDERAAAAAVAGEHGLPVLCRTLMNANEFVFLP
ncbi:PSD1 and planctomycete cytochrome C domain-containing protein [Alienimonas sp. DA493]|uniref:PSD1 and planctomycete cytochrome C domain-containing protein n=1 Tax=Alienimonas sp. DA493 TaxID=3373605 RepID=UPI003754F431